MNAQTTFDAVAQLRPLETATQHITCYQGQTVAQILAQFELSERYGIPSVRLQLGIRFVEIPITDWAKLRPKAGTRLEVFWPVRGPAIGALLTALISGAAPAIAGTVFGLAAGTWGYALTVAAITVVGGLIVNALVPPATPSAGASVETNYAVSGTQNVQNRYGIYPKVLGRHRMYPPMSAKGYTEVIDGEIYYRGRYTFGHGPLALEDLRIGNTPITEFEGVEIEFLNVDQATTEANINALSPMVKNWRSGTEAMSLYSHDVAEDGQSVRLMQGVATVRYTRDRISSASLDITFPQGLAKVSGASSTEERSVEIGFRFREVGAAPWIDAGTKICSARDRAMVRFTHEIAFPNAGEFEIEATRLTEDNEANDVVNDSYLTAIRSFRTGDLPSHIGIAEIAIRMKASEQLNGQVDSLNATVQQLAPVWDGLTWSDPQPMRHPAWILADAIGGLHLRRSVGESRIILDDLKAWADQEPHWTCDYVVDTEMTVREVMDLICAAGQARRALTDLKYSIIRDLPSQPVRQVFTPRNSWGFKGQISFPRDIHGFRVMARSERLEWEQDEILVFRDGYDETNATEFETLELPGVVITKGEADQGNAWRLGRYHLAAVELRPESFEFHADWEFIRTTRGDKIQFVHDVPKAGVGHARIAALTVQNGTLLSLGLDDSIDAPVATYRITVRDALGQRHQFMALVDGTGADWVSGEVDSSAIAVGDLVVVEEMTQESLELIVTNIFPSSDESARITAVPAAPEILNAVDGEIPNYAPIISDISRRYGPALAVVVQVVTGRGSAIVERDGALTPRIGVDLMPRGYTQAVKAVMRWRRAGELSWSQAEPQLATSTVYTTALADGETYAVEVQAIDAAGRGQGFVAAGNVQARARNFDYVAPAGFVLLNDALSVTLAGDPYPFQDFREFRFYGATDQSDVLSKIGESTSPRFTYAGAFTRFKVTAADHSGDESPATAWISGIPRGVYLSDLADETAEAIAAASARADVVLDTASAHTNQLRQDVTGAIGDLNRLTTLSDDMAGLRDQQIEDIARIDTDLELRRNQEANSEAARAQIADLVLGAQLRTSQIRSDMSDAGIVVDPATGQITIEAVSRLDGEIGSVAIGLDAVRAQISLTASYQDVATIVAQAQLGPENMPIITEFQGRISTVELDLDALSGAIGLKADTLVVDSLSASLTQALVEIDSLTQQITLRVTQSELSAVDTRLTAAEVSLSGIDGARFGIALSDISAAQQDLEDQATATLWHLVNDHTARQSELANLAYLRQDMVALVTEDRGSIASLSTQLGASFSTALALIETEVKARATETSALAETLSAMQVEVGAAQAGLTEINRIEIDSDSAAARALHQIQSDVEQVSGDLAGNGQAITALDLRVEDTEGSLEIAASDRRQLSAGITEARSEASLANLRSQLLDHVARAQFWAGMADAREDFYARVNEGEAVTAGALSELTAGLAGAISLVTAERIARVLAGEAEAAARLLLSVALTQAEADLAQEALVRATENTATAQFITEATARIEDAEAGVVGNATAHQGLATTVVAQDDAITTLAGRSDSLEATVNDATTGVGATATALGSVITQVSDHEGDLSALVADVTRLSVSDSTNLVPGGHVSDDDQWLLFQGWSLIAPAIITGIKTPGILRFAPAAGVSGWSQSAQSAPFEVSAGSRYAASFQARRDGAGSVLLRGALVWFDVAGAQVGYDVIAEPLIGDAEVHSFAATLIAPAGAVLAEIRFLVNLDVSSTGGDIAAPRVEREGDVSSQLRGDIESIFAMQIDATSAFGTWINGLTSWAGETTASVTQHGSSLATLQGSATATFALRLGAGGASAGLELVAADDPIAGPTELIRLKSQHIKLDGNVEVTGDFLTGTLLAETAWIQSAMIGDAQIGTLQISGNSVSWGRAVNRNDQLAGTGYTGPSDPWLTYMQIDLDLAQDSQNVTVDAAITMNGATVAGPDTLWSFRIMRADTGGILFSTQAEMRQPSIYIRGKMGTVAAGARSFLLQYRLGTALTIQNASMTADVTFR